MALSRSFYQRKTLDVAKGLLGCFLVRKVGNKIIRGTITETEAYIGEDDLACHASKGRTKRTEIMYGYAGHAYVYMIYGMYHCLNVVTERKNFPAAVLIRSIQIEGIEHKKTNGPGKLCKFLKVDRKLNVWDMTRGEKLWVEKPAQKISKKSIVAGRRIGIDYARHCKHYLWRFSLENKNDKYAYKAYDPIFKKLFDKEKKRLQMHIKADCEIEHIGSTAIPKLGGKGIIDIMIGAHDGSLENIIKEVKNAGYEFRQKAGSSERKFFRANLDDPITGKRLYHIHIAELNSQSWREAIAFREYLRMNLEKMKEYDKLKKEISKKAQGKEKAYKALKDPFIKKVLSN